MNTNSKNIIYFIINILMIIALWVVIEHFRSEVANLKRDVDKLQTIIENKEIIIKRD